MKINWTEILGENRPGLLTGSICSIAVAIFFLIIYLSRPSIQHENDLYYLSGPFESYNVDNSGIGSELTFRLQNRSNRFQVPAEFSGFLKKKEFYRIEPGDTISIGIASSQQKFLNKWTGNILVYSIKKGANIYLNPLRTIKRHNSIFPLVAVAFFFLLGVGVFYYRQNIQKESQPFELS